MRVRAGRASSAMTPSGSAAPCQVLVTNPVMTTLRASDPANSTSPQRPNSRDANSGVTASSTDAHPTSPPVTQASAVIQTTMT